MVSKIPDFVHRVVAHIRREEGQALAEYSLALAFVFAVCVLAVTAVGLAVTGHLQAFADVFP